MARSSSPVPHEGATWRDESGRALTDYVRPSLAVDTAVLTVAPRPVPSRDRPALQLQVLLVHRAEDDGGPEWALPGTFLHERERLHEAVARSLAEKCGFTGRFRARQLQVFDEPDRDFRGWVISVAHLAAIPYEDLAPLLRSRPDRLRLARASGPGPLPYDHAKIVGAGVARLRSLYRRGPDPLHLLGGGFTMRQLRELHEAVAGELLQKDTFRRAMEPLLRPTQTLSSGLVGRPSQVFRRP